MARDPGPPRGLGVARGGARAAGGEGGADGARPGPGPRIVERPLVRRLTRGLDRLPWPWGEEVMAVMGVIQALVRPARFLRALRWARAQPGSRRHWRLACALLAYHGRFIAQDALVGVRNPDAFRDRLIVEGFQHLGAAGGRGAILLGFHLGPTDTAFALRVAGHRVSAALSDRPRRAVWGSDPGDGQVVPVTGLSQRARAGGLHQALEVLRRGETLYITADGPQGTEAFRIPLPGGPLVVRSGWLALRRCTGAVTLPVLAHLEGRRRVITVHPPLPPPAAEPGGDAASCREVLTPLIQAYVRRFPEQCRSLAFWS